MGKTRWLTGSLVGLALVAGSVTPAQARPRYDRGWHHGHYQDGDGFGVGDAIGIAALLGAAAIVATSISKDRKADRASSSGSADDIAHDDRADAPPPANGTDYGADMHEERGPSGRDAGRDEDFSDVAGTPAQEDAMADSCARAARDEAQADGGYAEVRRMDAAKPVAGGSYNIDGEVETRDSYRAATGTTRRFTCTMTDGRVAQVYLSRDVATR